MTNPLLDSDVLDVQLVKSAAGGADFKIVINIRPGLTPNRYTLVHHCPNCANVAEIVLLPGTHSAVRGPPGPYTLFACPLPEEPDIHT